MVVLGVVLVCCGCSGSAGAGDRGRAAEQRVAGATEGNPRGSSGGAAAQRERVVSGTLSRVVGTSDAAELRRVAAVADRAVRRAGQDWPGAFSAGRRVTVEVPPDRREMERRLGVAAGAYRDYAAMAVPDGRRIVLNPEAYARLGDTGRQVVLTHEAVHLATAASTRRWTPQWLREGYADHVGYRRSGLTDRRITAELSSELAAGRRPRALPADREFGIGPTGSSSGDSSSRGADTGVRLAATYELAWTACELIADRYGTERLAAFYRELGRAPGTDRAMRRTLGIPLDRFTTQWLRTLSGPHSPVREGTGEP